ncbi:protein translocase subunit SecF [Candidatus Peregrinibacteria bacterium]|nr:protein translocase subunit SecF [Candidatus Peregrinibacteria bacterium]
MKGNNLLKVIIILVVAAILGFLDLPPNIKAPYLSWAPDFIKNQQTHLGLDLQGGSELDYKIDLRKVPEADRKNIVEGVKEVINRRVNSLGVSEPNIFISEVADESHIVVDLAGVDIEEAKEIIGKTIQLEFKEQKEATIDPNEKSAIENEANEILRAVKAGEDFVMKGKEEELSNPGRVTFFESEWKYKDEINNDIADKLFSLKKGEVYQGTVDSGGEYTVSSDGRLVEMTSINLLKLLDSQDAERTITTQRKVGISHILISYQGAERADESVIRTKDEARKRAEEILTKLKGGEKFEDAANEFTDDPSGKNQGGVLNDPAGDGLYTQAFESAALALTQSDQLSEIVETEFGFHILKAGTITPSTERKEIQKQIKYAKISYSTIPNPWKDTPLSGQHFKHAFVDTDDYFQPFVSIEFNDEGARLFAEITERNIGKPVAIFVGGDMISAPTVQVKIPDGKARITGNFTLQEANALARDLNTGAIPAPIILAGQYTIGATLGQEALNSSLWAGLIGIFLVAVFMIVYYRLPGLIAVIALSIYSAILLFLIQSTLHTVLAAFIAVGMFIYLMLKVLNSKDNGWEKLLTSTLAVFALFFIVYLLANPIVLTLAGIAGVILSIGMAVDANILIFERIKEEMRTGQPLSAALEIGFDKAWNSIRDSNFSSLITCAILFFFGSSIIQGFAFNLAAGILVSMFTAITITKSFIKLFVGTKLASNEFLFNSKPKKAHKTLKIIENTKIWVTLSGTMLGICVIALFAWGLPAGLDFTGGTLMQIKFENEVKPEEIKLGLEEIGKEISSLPAPAPAEEPIATVETPSIDPVIESGSEILDLSTANIIASSEGYIIKTKYMTNEQHDTIISKLQEKFGELEEIKFTTVGPVVGDAMKSKATLAIIVALIAIVLYIAFAFRKIPRNLSPWRFGICAIIALAHDVLLIIGIYAIFGFIFKVEVDALFITALLTILGFSVHDTIVVFDRIRDNLKHINRETSFKDVVNIALTQTMARSINTSFSTLLTLMALLLLGSSTLFWFVLALVLGVIIGTYSSVFVASTVLVWWDKRTKKA